MRNRREAPRRSDIAREIDEHGEKMTEQEEFMETATSDAEEVRDTLDSVELDTTQDGAVEVEANLTAADNEAKTEFQGHDETLERVHDGSAEFEGDLGERETAGESNQERVEMARNSVEIRNVLDHVQRTLEAIKEDVAFLRENREHAETQREDSKRTMDELRARIAQRG